jgi:PhnB protein
MKSTESTALGGNKSDSLLTLNSRLRRPQMAVQPIPKGYHSVTPYLIVKGASRAIDYYKQAFGATEIMRFPGPNNTIAHAEIKIGDSVVMLADAAAGSEFRDPQSVGGSSVGLMIYVPEVDQVFSQAVSLGGKETRPVKDQFYGDRSGTLIDPFGHVWTIATHVEDLSMQEVERRMSDLAKTA